jgi:hypothetical protein
MPERARPAVAAVSAVQPGSRVQNWQVVPASGKVLLLVVEELEYY